MSPPRDEEIFATAIAGLLDGARHVAVGMASPLPGTGALLGARTLRRGDARLDPRQPRRQPVEPIGGQELFDLAGRGGIDGFFLSGGQIDGQGNINLVGVGDYPETRVRWSGLLRGRPYLYFVVPRVILFRWEHTRRTLVEKVDFVSAPGRSAPGVAPPRRSDRADQQSLPL